MTDLWLHVNTFFIIVLIFFGYSSYIKKYMAAYFICLRKLSFYSDNAIKFITLFLKASLPGTVKPAPAKLCTVFLCTLLNRLRFSPQNVGFGTKNAPGSGLALSGAAAPALPKGEPNPLSHRCAMPAPPKGELNSLSQSLTALTAPSGREPLAKPETLRHSLKPSPWGRWLDAKRQDGRGAPSRQRARPLRHC